VQEDVKAIKEDLAKTKQDLAKLREDQKNYLKMQGKQNWPKKMLWKELKTNIPQSGENQYSQ